MKPKIENQELPLAEKIHAPNYIVVSATANKDGDIFYIVKDETITAVKMVDVWHDIRGCYGKFRSADGTEYEVGEFTSDKFSDNAKNGFSFSFGKGKFTAYSSVKDARSGTPMEEKRLNEMLVAPFGEDGEPERLENNGSDRQILAHGYGLRTDGSPSFQFYAFSAFAIVATAYGDLVTFIIANSTDFERVWLKRGSLFANSELAEHHARWARLDYDVVDFPKED